MLFVYNVSVYVSVYLSAYLLIYHYLSISTILSIIYLFSIFIHSSSIIYPLLFMLSILYSSIIHLSFTYNPYIYPLSIIYQLSSITIIHISIIYLLYTIYLSSINLSSIYLLFLLYHILIAIFTYHLYLLYYSFTHHLSEFEIATKILWSIAILPRTLSAAAPILQCLYNFYCQS